MCFFEGAKVGKNEIHNRSGAIVRFMDDYEEAKEWVL